MKSVSFDSGWPMRMLPALFDKHIPGPEPSGDLRLFP